MVIFTDDSFVFWGFCLFADASYMQTLLSVQNILVKF